MAVDIKRGKNKAVKVAIEELAAQAEHMTGNHSLVDWISITGNVEAATLELKPSTSG